MKEIELYNGSNPHDDYGFTKVSIIKAYGHTIRLTIRISWVDMQPKVEFAPGYSQIENLAENGWHIILTSHDETLPIPGHRYKGEVWKEEEDGSCEDYTDKFKAKQNAITNGWKAIIKHLYAPEEE